jgi:hypothetical protein
VSVARHGDWVPAVIQRVAAMHGVPLYDVRHEDGAVEEGLLQAFLRPWDASR